MAEMFTNYADFKQYVGGRLNQSVKIESIEPTIYEAARRHITPYITQELYDTLVAAVGLNSYQKALAALVKRALALLTVYEYAKVAVVEFGESGMHRIESDTRKTAYRYQERAYTDDALTKGYNELEEVMKYLESNIDEFPDWASSDEGMTHRSCLIRYASEFRKYALPECDRYTYECIRPIINEVQQYGVQNLLPEAFWDYFVAAQLDGSLTSDDKKALTMMKQSIAHRSITEAVRQQWIKIDKGRVSIQEDFGDQRNTNNTMPTSTGSALYLSHEGWSDRYTSKWISFMRDNPESFPTLFDEASGGTNTDADAWHINTDAEQLDYDAERVVINNRPIFRM